ncbi:hypothetical protein HY643_01510 [Candidatus Woesearchaeota archaeon]|nr:hypothetical protein [Candidatus Woesearchaeota archaeon]
MGIEEQIGDAAKSAVGSVKQNYSNFKSTTDVRTLSKRLVESGKGLAKLQSDWNEELDGGKLKSWLKKPRDIIYGLAEKLPGRAGEHFREEAEKLKDPFTRIEEECKSYLNDIESMIVEVGQVVEMKKQEMGESKQTLEALKEENWDLRTIRGYLIERSGISLDESMKTIFEYADEQLTPADVERKRGQMISLLETNLRVQEESLKLLGVVARQGAETYEKAAMQYHGFKSNAQQLQTFRDAAMDLAGTNVVALDMKEMFSQYLDGCTKVAETAIDAFAVIDKNMVASEETVAKIKAAKERLETKLNAAVSGQKVTATPVKTNRVKV